MSDILKKELALRFKQFIIAEFRNQQEAADLLSGGQQAIVSKMANGRYGISNEAILILHEKKLLNINWFYTGKGSMKIKAHQPPDMSDLVNRVVMLNESLEQRVDFLYKVVLDIQESLSMKAEN